MMSTERKVKRSFQWMALLLMLLPLGVMAQTIQVKGTVVDNTGLTVIGASVLEKGTTNGVITDLDGNPLINEIRKVYGNMPAMTGTTQAEVQAQIEHERIVEFPLESYRWYDLRRWGKLSEALQGRGYVAVKHDFYPIPLWEVNANSALNYLAAE